MCKLIFKAILIEYNNNVGKLNKSIVIIILYYFTFKLLSRLCDIQNKCVEIAKYFENPTVYYNSIIVGSDCVPIHKTDIRYLFRKHKCYY